MFHHTSRKPCIAFESSYQAKDCPKAKLQQDYEDGVKKKLEVPIADGTSFEGVLYTIREFHEASIFLDFDTGDELFSNFRL